MNAKHSEPAKIQEIHDVILQTTAQISELKFTKKRFCSPCNTTDDLIAEGIVNRVLRITEELGRVDSKIAQAYSFDCRGARDIRNILAHAYGTVDREIVWAVITEEFPGILESCQRYADDNGYSLE